MTDADDTTDAIAYRNWLDEGRRRGWLAKYDALAVAVDEMGRRYHANCLRGPYDTCPSANCRAAQALLAAYRAEEKP